MASDTTAETNPNAAETKTDDATTSDAAVNPEATTQAAGTETPAEPTAEATPEAKPEAAAKAKPEPAADAKPEAAAEAKPEAAAEAKPEAAAEAKPEPAAETGDKADGGDGGDGKAKPADGKAKPDGDGKAKAEGAEGADGEKKKRKRKRKKKPGAHPGRPANERAPFRVGEDVFGKVTAVLPDAIMIDLSGKALAVFDRSEMEADDLVPGVADRFVAKVLGDGSRGGLVVLTRKPLRVEDSKPKVEAAAKDGTLIKALVTGVIKGGVDVDIDGLRAFAPASGVDLHPARANLAGLLGQRMDFKVAEYKNNGRDVIVTRRPMLEQEAHERRKKALETLEVGQTIEGVVRSVVEWGAFLSLPAAEGLEGLVHISEASHDPHARLETLFKAGDKVEVKIGKIDEKGKIWLSRKALVPDPWAEVKEKYAPRSLHKGKVKGVESFGAFIELEEGIEGLMHISDMGFDRVEDPNELYKVGEEIEVLVHRLDPRDRKLALHPAPPPERADEAPQKVARGQRIKVEVVRAEGTAGVIVRVLGTTGRSQRGFIPGSQTGLPRGAELRRKFKAGDPLEVKVIDMDPRRGEPKLSIRGLSEDDERRAHKEYRKAAEKENKFGTLADLFAKAKAK